MLKLLTLAVPSLIASALLVAAPTSTRADLRPPPMPKGAPEVPAGARAWFDAAEAAMKDGDAARFAALCDPRGLTDNLVGGSGNPLESIFEQGTRKGWRLAIDPHDLPYILPGKKGVILRPVVVSDGHAKPLDRLYLLLVTSKDAAGKTVYRALGAGEDRDEVHALARRYLTGAPLSPPAREPVPAE